MWKVWLLCWECTQVSHVYTLTELKPPSLTYALTELKRPYLTYAFTELKQQVAFGLMICLSYNSVISFALTYAISALFTRCSEKLLKDISNFRKRVWKMVSPDYHDMIDICSIADEKKCMSLTTKMMENPLHLHMCIKVKSGKITDNIPCSLVSV